MEKNKQTNKKRTHIFEVIKPLFKTTKPQLNDDRLNDRKARRN